jgi:16S rRNA (guanine527-N7)-methyltransferase
MASDEALASQVLATLAEAQRQKFIGPASLEEHVEHARGFHRALGDAPAPGLAADLGSGGGLPALVLALSWPETPFWLVEANQRRAQFLIDAVEDLGWADRIEVVAERAEEVGRLLDRRGKADLVTARGFAPPAVTAECAAPLLRPEGRLVVSEPPSGSAGDRWPATGLAILEMRPGARLDQPEAHYQVVVQDDRCPDQYPRRVGVPAKRPLF